MTRPTTSAMSYNPPTTTIQTPVLYTNTSTQTQIRALVTALPTRYRLSNTWTLVYSTQRHGISLQTLYRRAQTVAPTILVVRDTGGYVFGAYCSEPWHVAARYFGTGETFVFQLQVGCLCCYGGGDGVALLLCGFGLSNWSWLFYNACCFYVVFLLLHNSTH